jgi:hypothetical protein
MSELGPSNFDKYGGEVAGSLIIWMLIACYPAVAIGFTVGMHVRDRSIGIFVGVLSVVGLWVIKFFAQMAHSNSETGPEEDQRQHAIVCFTLYLIYVGIHFLAFVPFMQSFWWMMVDTTSSPVPFPDLLWFWMFSSGLLGLFFFLVTCLIGFAFIALNMD